MPKQIKRKFTMDRETKNTVRFQEEGPKEEQVMEKVYIKKADLEPMGNPESVYVTVTAA